ncbi:Hypothetical protein NGK_1644 [Neisseria gonorrhoeae NCCP11945]|uniref:Uncharacterized protein n=1 Tax=Neisseria gonorrhoeae (strain NCCP11945) TaxID=521006 RepID=B4RND4_NEIG2|nr:Hypothetical protein NGK_1644 [Neisseria gonorrhoeae NCCP11945]
MLTFSSKSKQKCRLNVEAKVQTAFFVIGSNGAGSNNCPIPYS